MKQSFKDPFAMSCSNRGVFMFITKPIKSSIKAFLSPYFYLNEEEERKNQLNY